MHYTGIKRAVVRKAGARQQTRALVVATSLLAALAGATVFLCARPAAAPVPKEPTRREAVRLTAAEAAMRSGELVVLADRHARDASHIAAQAADGAGEDLGWDYVQLRL